MGCPKPVMMAGEAVARMGEGIVEVLVDDEAGARTVEGFAREDGFFAEAQKREGHWAVKIAKGCACEAPAEDKKSEAEKGLMLVVGTDTLGKEEALGRMLMKALFETMVATRETPGTIFFLNAGVKLTTVDEEIIPVLKRIEDAGAEIYSCGTCLKYYGLEDRLKVGWRGSTDILLRGLKDHAKTAWI
jgi:selenium metabolism protein YedF